MDINEYLAHIQSADAAVRYAAWKSAWQQKSDAVVPLSKLAASPDKGVAKAASAALPILAHHSARPGAYEEAEAVANELIKVAESADYTMPVRANALLLIGCIAPAQLVPRVAKLMANDELREEVRMAVERIPGNPSVHALKAGLKSTPESFHKNIEQSLHNRSLTPTTVGVKNAR